MVPMPAPSRGGLRLNLGCGAKEKHMPGWVNVDRQPPADSIVDLERVPWPWDTDSVDEVELVHVLEHLGRDPQVYLAIMRELWRVCRHGARVHIVAPHPRHDHYLNDPTHVRPITPDGLRLFSARANREWLAAGASNSTLGLDLGIDLEVVSAREIPDPAWAQVMRSDWNAWENAKRHYFNVVMAYDIILRPVKDGNNGTGK